MTKAALLALVLAACGGSAKTGTTTPKAAGSGDQSMQNTPAPTGDGVAATGSGSAANNSTAFGGNGPDATAEAPVTYPDLDPDPGQAKAQVDQHLAVARAALSAPTPDPDTALREAKAALAIDATSLDAAAYVAFAYYHKHQYDTAELVLDDVFKRPSAKTNAGIYYVYGLVYDHTNRPDQAVLAFNKAVELNPNFASALVDVGVHQLENKQYAQAQETFEKLTKQFNRNDAITLTSLASAYRGHATDYPVGSSDRNNLIVQSEATYRRAIQANPNYGPAYFDLALLYLDADPFPSGNGTLDSLQRLNAAKDFLDKYKTMPGVDMKLYDERLKDVTKAIKREEKRRKKSGKAGSGGKGAP
ncbi:MAG TPA: tetratricopeptide repeat protein [Kofleriaceae bacterium]|jgi:tetratricopeptide (TPR) repeat protein